MNVLFITLDDVKDINDHGIFKDLYREFVKKGHYVYIVSPTERRNGEKTRLIINDNYLGLSLNKPLYLLIVWIIFLIVSKNLKRVSTRLAASSTPSIFYRCRVVSSPMIKCRRTERTILILARWAGLESSAAQ